MALADYSAERELRRQLAQQRKVLRNLLTAVDRHARLQLPESLALLDKRSEEARRLLR